MMVKIGLGVQHELHMAPILKFAVTLGEFRSAFKFGESIRVLCAKGRNPESERGNCVSSLCARDLSVAANLNGKIKQ
jgi:hypothetical protein